ncbi:hypothetical protein [Gordonia sp. UCD-TK1]|uniref:hypothetical protein n=1 Tax=Gordonia sp. UCD-TK1 TaxID=1857893 RepID=UPI0009F52F6A
MALELPGPAIGDLPPGRPDIAFTRWRVAVFVDGVFWHGHPEHWNPETASSDYWRQKIARNVQRDRQVDAELARNGWEVVRIWDLDVRDDLDASVNRVLSALRSAGKRVGGSGSYSLESASSAMVEYLPRR